MRTNTITFACLIFSCLVSGHAEAGLFAEPWLGYSTGSGKAVTTASSSLTNNTSTVSGGEVGMRLGAKAGWLWLAIDPNYFYGRTKTTSTNGTSSDDTTRQSSFYGLVGLDLPIRIKVYAGGSLLNELKTQNTATQTYSLNGYKAGLGFRVTPRFTTLIEYRLEKVTKISDSSSGITDVAANYTSFEKNRGTLAVSYLF